MTSFYYFFPGDQAENSSQGRGRTSQARGWITLVYEPQEYRKVQTCKLAEHSSFTNPFTPLCAVQRDQQQNLFGDGAYAWRSALSADFS